MLRVYFLHAVGQSEEVFSVLRVHVKLSQLYTTTTTSSRRQRQKLMELKDEEFGHQS